MWPDYRKWATSTVAHTYDPADSALVGQPLEIRLLNLRLDKDDPPGNTVGVEFDNVTLFRSSGPLVGGIHHDINRFTMSMIMNREVEGLFRQATRRG